MLLRNICWLSTEYMALYFRRQRPSWPQLWNLKSYNNNVVTFRWLFNGHYTGILYFTYQMLSITCLSEDSPRLAGLTSNLFFNWQYNSLRPLMAPLIVTSSAWRDACWVWGVTVTFPFWFVASPTIFSPFISCLCSYYLLPFSPLSLLGIF